MAKITNYQQLIKEIKKKVNIVLKDTSVGSVFDIIKENEQKNINQDVYSYSPEMYVRRSTNGGLVDSSNFKSNVNNETLDVLNVAEPNESILGTSYTGVNTTTFASWIENGDVSNIFNNQYYAWMSPREFTQNTIEDLKNNKQHVKALKKGLAKEGLDVN